MSINRRRALLLLAICGIPLSHARAVEIGNGVAPTDSSLTYVGKITGENTTSTEIVGTGEVINSTGVVMTAAHVVANLYTSFTDRFSLNGKPYFGLSVPDPNYSGNGPLVSYGVNDIALMVLANYGGIANADPGTLATVAQQQDIVTQINNGTPENVTFDGWTTGDSQLAANLQQGTSQIKFVPASYDGMTPPGLGAPGSDANNWTFDPTLKANTTTGYTGSNWLDHGDSGGPAFATIDGKTVIIGVYSFAPDSNDPALFNPKSATVDVETSVTPYLPFLNGMGDGGASNLVYLNSATTDMWSDATNWKGGAVPGNQSIAILDPTTTGSDTGTTISLSNGNSANLNGLLNDTTLVVSNQNTLSVTGKSGVTNTGIITLQDNSDPNAPKNTMANIYYQLDNEGTINVTGPSTLYAGFVLTGTTTLITTVLPTESMLNGSNAILNVQSGGSATAFSGMENFGTININNGGNSATTSSLSFANRIGISGPAPTNPTVQAFTNGPSPTTGGAATINVGAGGNFTQGNGNAIIGFTNSMGAKLNIQGDSTGAANASIYQIQNSGTLMVGANGNLDAAVDLAGSAINKVAVTNDGTITVSGSSAFNAVANLGQTMNTGAATVNAAGTINTTQLTNGNAGTVTVNSGGTFNVNTPTDGSDAPAVTNYGPINITSGSAIAIMQVSGQEFDNQGSGVITLAQPNGFFAQLQLNNSNLVNDGKITGAGAIGNGFGGSITNNANGIITAGDGARLTIGGAVGPINMGTINVGATVNNVGSEISITGGGTGTVFENEGTINMPTGGFLDSGPATNTGYAMENTNTITGNGSIQFSGGVSNSGTITQSGGNLTIQSFNSNSANLNLNGSGNTTDVNVYYDLLVSVPKNTSVNFTNTGDITLSGNNANLFGVSTGAAFTNNGSVSSNGNLHDIDFAGAFTNNGTITAAGPLASGLPTNGNYNLQLNNLANHGQLTNNPTGVILATNGATLVLSTGTINKGALRATTGSAILNAPNGSIVEPVDPASNGPISDSPMTPSTPNLINTGTVNIDPTSTLNIGSFEQDGDSASTTIDGNLDGTIDLIGGTVGGGGTVTGALTEAGGDLLPGDSDSPDLTINGGILLDPAATLTIDIASLASFDQLDFGDGNVNLDGTLQLNLDPSYTPTHGDTFPIILADGDNSGDELGQFTSLEANIPYDNGFFQINYAPSDNPTGVDVEFVPEPGSAGILLLTTAILFARRRPKRGSQA